MKALLLFLITMTFVTGTLVIATKAENPWPNFALAFGVWMLFMRWMFRRSGARWCKSSATKKNKSQKAPMHYINTAGLMLC